MSFAAWWGSRHIVFRVLAVLAAGWVTIVVILGNSDAIFGAGPSLGSPASTTSTGYAAYVSLLESNGHRVTVVPGGEVPAAGGTVIVGDIAPTPATTSALARVAASGAKVVILGGDPIETDRALAGPGVLWSAGGQTVASAVPGGRGPHGVATVTSDGDGVFTAVGRATATVRSAAGTLVATERVGHGSVTLVADPSVLANEHLASADNAALGLDLAGAGGAVAVMDTGTAASGIGALPARWRWAALVAVIAWAAWVWSRAHRLGPKNGVDERPTPAARGTYVTSLATTLARSRDPRAAGDAFGPTVAHLVREGGARHTATPVVGEGPVTLPPVTNEKELIELARTAQAAGKR